MLSDPDFVPFEPPPRPLGLVGLPLLWPNYIEAIPRAGYEQGVTRVQTRWSDLVLVCDPELAFGDNDGIIADHRPERPAGRRIAPGTNDRLSRAERSERPPDGLRRWQASGRAAALGEAERAGGCRGGDDPHHFRHHRRGDVGRLSRPQRRAFRPRFGVKLRNHSLAPHLYDVLRSGVHLHRGPRDHGSGAHLDVLAFGQGSRCAAASF